MIAPTAVGEIIPEPPGVIISESRGFVGIRS
jgi:hypothetical protein